MKKNNKELERRINEQSVTFQSIGDGVIIVDKREKIILFNNRAGQLTGWSCDEATGKSLSEVFCLVNKRNDKPCKNPATKAMNMGKKVGLPNDTVLISRDGSRLFLSASCAPIMDGRKKVKGAVFVFRDITRIKEAENAVIESEKRYRTIVENSYELIYEVDSLGNILYVNPPCTELTGYEQSELTGKNAFEFIHPDDLPNALETFRRAVLNMTTETATFRARDKNGQYNWLECTGNPFITGNGEIRGVIITRDITERVESEKKIRYQLSIENALAEISKIFVSSDDVGLNRVLNILCTTLAVNSGYVYQFPESGISSGKTFSWSDSGTDSEEHINQNIDCALYPWWMKKLTAGENIAIEDTDSLPIEADAEKKLFKSNNIRSLIAVPIISAKGELWGYMSLNDAQRSRVWLEEEIRLLRIAGEILSAYKMRKKAEEELTLLNKLMEAVHRFLDLEEVYKVALDTIISMQNVDIAMIYLLDEERKEAVLEAYRNVPDYYLKKAAKIPCPVGITWKVINSGKIINIEDAQKDPDIGPSGKKLGHHSLLGMPIYLKHNVIGVIWFLSYKERKFSEKEVLFLSALGDQIAIAIAKAKMIDEIKKTQEQLIQSEKLASLGQLISSIAHEINNPLTPIIGYSQRLLTKPDIDRQNKDSIEIIHSSAQRVHKVIEKLLSFSRKYSPVRSYEDINDLLEKSIEFREYQLKLDNIKIAKKLDAALPRTMVDPNQIQQVFTNVILNAEQAVVESQNRGSLEVSTGIKKDSIIEISFTDDGPGIPEKIKGKIFDPFFTTKEPGKGTGLGLSVAYGIIKEHGGDIQIQNKRKEGTRFIITLPIIKPDTKPQIGKDEIEHGFSKELKKKRVLIVEDEAIVTELVKAVLEEGESIVDVASNGREALKKINSSKYDLIVCDIKMPEINGVNLFYEVKKTNPELSSRFIFITGDPSDETIDFLHEAGNPYIIKPFKLEKFKVRVNEIFCAGFMN